MSVERVLKWVAVCDSCMQTLGSFDERSDAQQEEQEHADEYHD